jgi:hypothetical protein
MKQPFDLKKFRHRISQIPRDPSAPTDQELEHSVRLLPISSDSDQHARWMEPQAWCRLNVQHQLGHEWSRRMDRESGRPVFSFSDLSTGVMFALKFR